MLLLVRCMWKFFSALPNSAIGPSFLWTKPTCYSLMKESTSMALTNEDNINSLKDILLIFPVLPGPPLPTTHNHFQSLWEENNGQVAPHRCLFPRQLLDLVAFCFENHSNCRFSGLREIIGKTTHNSKMVLCYTDTNFFFHENNKWNNIYKHLGDLLGQSRCSINWIIIMFIYDRCKPILIPLLARDILHQTVSN